MKQSTKELLTDFQLQQLESYRYAELIQVLAYELAEHDKEVKALLKGKSVIKKSDDSKLTDFNFKNPLRSDKK